MVRYVPRQTHTPADELRALLDASYNIAVESQGATPEALSQLLQNLDRIHALFPQLRARGVDLRPEETRWQEVQGAVRRHRDAILAGLAPLGGLPTLRSALDERPDEARWWWWMDQSRARERRRRVLTLAAILAGIIMLLAGGVWTFNRLFPTDERVIQAYEYKTRAEEALRQGHRKEALQSLEAAYALTPDDPDILSLLAVLYDLEQRPQKAATFRTRLLDQFPPSITHANLAQSYLLAGAIEKALALARQAIREDAANPQGYLIAGMVYEAQGQRSLAAELYQQAAEKAHAAGEYETEAFAKVRLAHLLRQ